MNLFISPHCDDETLFGAYTIMREKPIVAIFKDVLHIYRHDESRAALDWLELPRDNIKFISALHELGTDYEKVYAPAMQGGHPFHDEVCELAIRQFGAKVVLYSTYTKNKASLPFGRWKVEPVTERMRKRKVEALRYYESQRTDSAVHFNQKCKDEYYF